MREGNHMRTLKVHLVFQEELLGTASSDPEIHRRYIASKAEDAPKIEQEVASLGVEAVDERGTTVFSRMPDGETPMLWDYQIKGFFKDACGMLRRVPNMKSKNLRAYKKEVDGLIQPSPRFIQLHLPDGGEMGTCQRPLRAATAQGERVALASSEAMPAGTWLDMEVSCMVDSDVAYVLEWLQYGAIRGIGQWRNSGKGRFFCRVTEGGKVLLDNLGRSAR